MSILGAKLRGQDVCCETIGGDTGIGNAPSASASRRGQGLGAAPPRSWCLRRSAPARFSGGHGCTTSAQGLVPVAGDQHRRLLQTVGRSIVIRVTRIRPVVPANFRGSHLLTRSSPASRSPPGHPGGMKVAKAKGTSAAASQAQRRQAGHLVSLLHNRETVRSVRVHYLGGAVAGAAHRQRLPPRDRR